MTRRVLFVLNSMAGGGAQRAVVNLLRTIDRARFTPSLALFAPTGPYLSRIPEDVPVIDLSGLFGVRRTLRLRRRLIDLLKSTAPDVINTHLHDVNRAVLRGLCGTGSDVPVLVTEQNNPTAHLSTRFSRAGQFVRRSEACLLYRRARRIVAISGGIRDELVNRFNVDASRIVVIHNSVDLAQVRTSVGVEVEIPLPGGASSEWIVSVGRLTEQKAQDDLLRAFERVRRRRDCRLVILGAGPRREPLERLALDLGVADDLFMPGFVSNPWAYVARARVFVLSSHWEGFANVVVEAMACGTPVISTDCPFGPGEIIANDRCGVLVPVGDVEAMGDQMDRLLGDAELRRRLAAGGLERAGAFDTTVVTRAYEDLFEEVT